ALLLVAIERGGDGFNEFGLAVFDRVGPRSHAAAMRTAAGLAAGSIGHDLLRLQGLDRPVETFDLLEPFAGTGVFEHARLCAVCDQILDDDLIHFVLLLVWAKNMRRDGANGPTTRHVKGRQCQSALEGRLITVSDWRRGGGADTQPVAS